MTWERDDLWVLPWGGTPITNRGVKEKERMSESMRREMHKKNFHKTIDWERERG